MSDEQGLPPDHAAPTQPLSSEPPPSGPPPGEVVAGSSGRSRPQTRTIAVASAAALLLAGAGFVAGLTIHHSDAADLVTRTSQAVGGGGPGGAGGGEGGSSRMRGGLPVTGVAVGQIASISGSTFTLRGFAGHVLTVTTSSGTRVDDAAAGDLTSLAVGQLIVVQGTRGTDGTFAAAIIRSPRHMGVGGGVPGMPGAPNDDGTGNSDPTAGATQDNGTTT